MAYFDSKTVPPNTTGSYAWDFNATVPGIKLGQIIDTGQTFYTGQSFEIIERAIIQLTVTDPTLIDIDYRWPAPIRYLGTYTTTGVNGFTGNNQNMGRIWYDRTVLERKHLISIGGNPTKTTNFEGYGSVFQCNLELVPASITPKGGGDPVDGYITSNREPVFSEQYARATTIFVNDIIETELNYISVHAYQGVEITTLSYQIATKGIFRADNAALPNASCTRGGCNEEFNAWVLAHNGGQPIDSGASIFSSQALCEIGTNHCLQGSYLCTSGESRIYWYVDNAG
jgi:hypothetical protein